MYFFKGTLVYLAAQLVSWPDAVNYAIASIIEFYPSESLDETLNAVILSIEHTVFMRLHPDGRVERTHVMPLFNIPVHSSMAASARYSEADLKRLRERKDHALATCQLSDEAFDEFLDTSVELWMDDELCENEYYKVDSIENIESTDETKRTFHALMTFLESFCRRRILLTGKDDKKGGVFPTEIYAIILKSVDLPTFRNCMQVSLQLRDICLGNFMIFDGVVLQGYKPDTYGTTPTLRMKMLSGQTQVVTMQRTEDLEYPADRAFRV
ncbi:MAG: hypothetical protein Q9179_007230, partial [Wetmoreana sp. 5 TL-2023]